MARGRHRDAAVTRREQQRTTRRTTRRRRRSATLAPWVIASVVIVALLLGGVSFGYTWVSRSGCEGPAATTTVVASPDQYAVMSALAQQWRADAPEVDGRCVAVAIARQDASQVAAALSPRWDERRDGPRPDVWAPDSTAWLLVASNRPDAAELVPAGSASIASSAIVMAMQQPMAEALGWPARKLGWLDLVRRLPEGTTWGTVGHPEWGPLRLGMTDPTRSTAGVNALLTLTDVNADDTVSDAELAGSLGFSRNVTEDLYVSDTDKLFAKLGAADSAEKALRTVAAFPAVEREIAAYDGSNPLVNLVPIYPSEGTAYADYPFAVLDAPWVDDLKRRTADRFLDFLISPTGRKAYGGAGFRDAAHSARYADDLDPARGFEAIVASPPRDLTVTTAITRTVVQWTALRRRSSVLAVFDTSGSMAAPAPGLRATRLQVLQQAAVQGLSLFNEASSVGLWQFSDELTATTDYRRLVPIGPIGDTVGRVPRKVALANAIRGLRPDGGTALYDTTLAAYREAQRRWQPNQLNLVVVMTDGKNENPDGLTLAQLTARLRAEARPDQPVAILTVAYTDDADVAALQRISEATGGRTFVSRRPVDIQRVFLAALFGR